MNKDLEVIKSFQNKRTFDVTYDNGTQKHYETKTIGELFHNEINKIEAELKDAKKYKKAVEIIKKKRVDTYFLMQTDTLEEYNKSLHTCSWFPSYELTEQEYNLLKEILCK